MVKGSKAALRLLARTRKNENRSGACARSGETHLADRLIEGAEVAVAVAFALAFLYLVIGLLGLGDKAPLGRAAHIWANRAGGSGFCGRDRLCLDAAG
jgi:hypothetical protein